MANAAADKKFRQALEAYDNAGMLAALKNGANPNQKNGSGNYALSTACWYCKTDLVREMIARGANINIAKGEPLLQTIRSLNGDTSDILQILIAHKVKINVQYKYQHNASALALAIENDKPQLAEILIAAGADLTLKNSNGKTPVQVAKAEGYGKLFQLMSGDKKKVKGKDKRAAAEIDPYIETVYTGVFTTGKTPHSSGEPKWASAFNGKHFPGCGNPPVHLLTIDLAKIPDFPDKIRKLGKFNIVFHNCECDEEDYYDFSIGRDGRLKTLDDYEKNECDPKDYHASKKASAVKLVPKDTGAGYRGIEIGGMPSWAQTPHWPSCPKCGKKSFFIAHIYQFYVPPSARGRGNTLNVFVCPDCRTQSMVRQNT